VSQREKRPYMPRFIEKLKKAGVSEIITTNCIEHPTNKIDISSLLVQELRKEK